MSETQGIMSLMLLEPARLLLLLVLLASFGCLAKSTNAQNEKVADPEDTVAAASARLFQVVPPSSQRARGRKRHIALPAPSVEDNANSDVVRHRKKAAQSTTERSLDEFLDPTFLAVLNSSHFRQQPEFLLAQGLVGEHQMQPFRDFGNKLLPEVTQKPEVNSSSDLEVTTHAKADTQVTNARVRGRLPGSQHSEVDVQRQDGEPRGRGRGTRLRNDSRSKVHQGRKTVRLTSASIEDNTSTTASKLEEEGAEDGEASDAEPEPSVMAAVNVTTTTEKPKQSRLLARGRAQRRKTTRGPAQAVTSSDISSATPTSAEKPLEIAKTTGALTTLPRTRLKTSTPVKSITTLTPTYSPPVASNLTVPSISKGLKSTMESKTKSTTETSAQRPAAHTSIPSVDRPVLPFSPSNTTTTSSSRDIEHPSFAAPPSLSTTTRASTTQSPSRRPSTHHRSRLSRYRNRFQLIRNRPRIASRPTPTPARRDIQEVDKVLGLLGRIKNRARTPPSFIRRGHGRGASKSSEKKVGSSARRIVDVKIVMNRENMAHDGNIAQESKTDHSNNEETTTRSNATTGKGEDEDAKYTDPSPLTSTLPPRRSSGSSRNEASSYTSTPATTSSSTAPSSTGVTIPSTTTASLSQSTPSKQLAGRRRRPDQLRRVQITSSRSQNLLARRLRQRQNVFSATRNDSSSTRGDSSSPPPLPAGFLPTVAPFSLILSTLPVPFRSGIITAPPLKRNYTVSVTFPPTTRTTVRARLGVPLRNRNKTKNVRGATGSSSEEFRKSGGSRPEVPSRRVLGTSLQTSVSIAVSPLEFKLRKRVNVSRLDPAVNAVVSNRTSQQVDAKRSFDNVADGAGKDHSVVIKAPSLISTTEQNLDQFTVASSGTSWSSRGDQDSTPSTSEDEGRYEDNYPLGYEYASRNPYNEDYQDDYVFQQSLAALNIGATTASPQTSEASDLYSIPTPQPTSSRRPSLGWSPLHQVTEQEMPIFQVDEEIVRADEVPLREVPLQEVVLEEVVLEEVTEERREPGPLYLVSLLFVLPVVAVALWYLKRYHLNLTPDTWHQLVPERLKSILVPDSPALTRVDPSVTLENDSGALHPALLQVQDTMSRRRKWEHPRQNLRKQSILGEGHFGQVWRAEAENVRGQEGLTIVAVKNVKETATPKDKQDLLRELSIMTELGSHPNVVTLLGCCTEQEPALVIMEYVRFGKLLTFLRENRGRHHYLPQPAPSDADLTSVTSHDTAPHSLTSSDLTAMTSRDLTLFACQVAAGMEYVARQGIVHRDLAARNILVDHNKVCKVSDFGMSRRMCEIGAQVFECKHRGALPIRWMSPESLYHNTFSQQTDCWSFGILLWEIITLGSTPYPGLSAREVMRSVREGYRLERPDHCHPQLYQLAAGCWSADPAWRPAFSEIHSRLQTLLEDESQGYVDLDRFQEEIYGTLHKSSDEKV